MQRLTPILTQVTVMLKRLPSSLTNRNKGLNKGPDLCPDHCQSMIRTKPAISPNTFKS